MRITRKICKSEKIRTPEWLTVHEFERDNATAKAGFSKEIRDKFAFRAYIISFFLWGNTLYFNEINTIPGMDNNGKFMRMWEKSGVSYNSFIDKTVDYAFKCNTGEKYKSL